MMKTVMNLLMTCAIVAMMSTSAMAGGDGGGGAKGNGTIVVTNNYPGYVMVVAVGTFQAPTVGQFLAAGAQFVQPNSSATFSVAPGSHRVNAIFINDVNFATAGPDSKAFNVVAGKTTSVSGVFPGELE